MLVKTKDGLEINVKENAFNSMETLDALTDATDGDPTGLSRLCRIIFSKEEKAKLYDFCRAEDGTVPLEKALPVITEIMTLLGEKEKK